MQHFWIVKGFPLSVSDSSIVALSILLKLVVSFLTLIMSPGHVFLLLKKNKEAFEIFFTENCQFATSLLLKCINNS